MSLKAPIHYTPRATWNCVVCGEFKPHNQACADLSLPDIQPPHRAHTLHAPRAESSRATSQFVQCVGVFKPRHEPRNHARANLSLPDMWLGSWRCLARLCLWRVFNL